MARIAVVRGEKPAESFEFWQQKGFCWKKPLTGWTATSHLFKGHPNQLQVTGYTYTVPARNGFANLLLTTIVHTNTHNKPIALESLLS